MKLIVALLASASFFMGVGIGAFMATYYRVPVARRSFARRRMDLLREEYGLPRAPWDRDRQFTSSEAV